MEMNQKLYLLKKVYEQGFGIDEQGFLDIINRVMENPQVFLLFCNHNFQAYIEENKFIQLLRKIDVLAPMLQAAKFYNDDPQAREDLNMLLDSMIKTFEENGHIAPSKEEMLITLIQTIQATELLVQAEKLSEEGQSADNPLELIKNAYFFKNEILIREFLATILVDKDIMVSLADLLGDIYLYSHPFIEYLNEEGLLDFLVEAMAENKDKDPVIKEGIRRYFKKTGKLLDFDLAQSECNQFLLSVITQTILARYAQDQCSLEEVLKLAH